MPNFVLCFFLIKPTLKTTKNATNSKNREGMWFYPGLKTFLEWNRIELSVVLRACKLHHIYIYISPF